MFMRLEIGMPLMSLIAEGTSAERSAAVTSVWDLLAKGGLRLIPIVICSLVALTLAVERFVSLRKTKVIPPTFATDLSAVLSQDSAARALEYCRSHASPIARVCEAGLRRWDWPLEQVEKLIAEAGQREVVVMRKNLRGLSVITSVAPLLGLLGTIIGMIKAFQTVAQSSDALGRTEVLAEGIYEAMITTAAGLTVAIPSLMMYHWFSSRVDGLVSEMDGVCVGLIDHHAANAVLSTHRKGVRTEDAALTPVPVAAVGSMTGTTSGVTTGIAAGPVAGPVAQNGVLAGAEA